MGIGIYSIEAGYITRVSINNVGAGRALYIQHPNGFTSVYFHLGGFAPHIRRAIEQQLGKPLTNGRQPHVDEVIDINFRPGQLMVSKGQFIARSGDSGSSQAPHLHLEIHDAKSGDMLDPMIFFKEIIKDTVPPQAHSFKAYPVEGAGVFNKTTSQQTYGFSSSNLTQQFTAWGKVGFGLWANDYTGVTYNHLGVLNTILTCDGDTVFSSTVDRIPLFEQREINAWGDYPHYLSQNVWYLRSYHPKGVHLPFLKTYPKYLDGYINFNQERDYHLAYTLIDAIGNTSRYSFIVHGQHQDIPPKTLTSQTRLKRCDRSFSWLSPSASLLIVQRSLGTDYLLAPSITEAPSDALSSQFSFASSSCPLFREAILKIRLTSLPSNPNEMVVATDLPSCPFLPIKSYNGGWVTVGIRELAAHYYVIDKNKIPVNK